ncbi:protein suppressor of white apricot isoform X2 [Drosophila rhopaloa]|uniref:Protein suppressor of white apricot isoform X2 n=1 Tax=Drosophila rhopaloa TaxID=1041015 RepID=A0A6P4FMJ6_DRORH|nr:protein suppressor of white apricot isoform X2 [Drosophila rhopaloa]
MMPYNVRNAGGGSVGGILRRTGHGSGSGSTVLSNGSTAGAAGVGGSSSNLENQRQTPLELLVFGYACKIFRDDEKAREMDHGKQLIPWMGDVNLKIDRYDVRGALCELAPHEAPPGGYGNRLEYLSAEEQRAEQLCEEERYLFLYNNEEELRLRQEEDLKRLQQETSGGNYSQVGFQYDGQSTASISGSSTAPSQLSPTSEDSELPFVLPYTLMMTPPLGMQLPDTMKQHAIIEKTARFIATQGAQMEILIKAKQANNAQFDFLTQGGHLQPYYRHLLAAIKAAKFPPAPETPLEQQNPDQESQSNDFHSGEVAEGRRNLNQVVITVPTIKYKPSANCAYTQLISKIKGVPLQAVLLEDESSNPEGNSQHSGGTASPTPSCRSEGHNSQGGEFTPVLLQYNGSTFTHEEEVTVQEQPENECNSGEPPQVELLKNSSALALAQNYSSESEEEEEPVQQEKELVKKQEPVLTFPVPEESLRHIIDKTATYVIKNGRQFEETLRTKSVERFSFLLPATEFYAYYLYKVTGDVDAASKEEKTRKAAAVAAALMSKKGLSFGGAAAAAAGNNLDKAPEASDEEASSIAGAEQVRPGMPDSVQRAIKQVETQLLARTAGQKVGGSSSTASSSSSSPQKEQRQAEERVKDKLAQIAREKLNGMISREKQLQLERKRKAMAFLNQIKGECATVGSAVSGAAPNPPEPAAGASQSTAADSDNESNESVRSIPITYFGPDDDDEVGDTKPEVRLEREMHEDEEDDDDDDGGDLEKYNLLNDDSTNTFTSKPVLPPGAPPPVAAVLLSDDDDVQLVATSSSRTSSSRHRKTHRRSRSRSRNDRSSLSSASSRESSHRRRQKSTKPSKMPSSIQVRKSQQQTTQRRKSPKKRRRSIGRSRSRSIRRSSSRSISRTNRRSRSRSFSTSRDPEQRRQQQRHRTPTKKTHKRHKRRRRSSSPR